MTNRTLNATPTSAATSNTTNPKDYFTHLYEHVDNRDAAAIGTHLAPDARFKFGNSPAVIGQNAVVDANESFFATIAGMSHTIDHVWADGAEIIGNGTVHYTRHDNTTTEAAFATVLTITEGLITDYMIYADISHL